ncbi:hypothetical protein K4K58_002828 [Colletotrichum sp. SAR11_239]|nr:hypothetical protein K4K58_002828 [Colletotrichum sp. SAR11_239]
MATTPPTDLEAGQASDTSSPSAEELSITKILRYLGFCRWPFPHVATELNYYVYRDEIERYPEGWPRLAAEQEAFENTAIHRKFGYLLQRCLLDSQCRITVLAKRLLDLDQQLAASRVPKDTIAEIADDANSPIDPVDDEPRREQVPEIQFSSENEEEGRRLPQMISQTIQEIWPLLHNHYQMVYNEKSLRSLHEVQRPEFWNRCLKIEDDGSLNKEEMEYLYHPEDFVSTAADPLWRTITGWMHLLPTSVLLFIFKDTRTKKQKFASSVSMLRMELFYKGVATLIYAIVLLLPIIFLYIFPSMIMMAGHKGTTLPVILVGACTYAAVLVAFLANLQGR